jgi:hypothetical protein
MAATKKGQAEQSRDERSAVHLKRDKLERVIPRRNLQGRIHVSERGFVPGWMISTQSCHTAIDGYTLAHNDNRNAFLV